MFPASCPTELAHTCDHKRPRQHTPCPQGKYHSRSVVLLCWSPRPYRILTPSQYKSMDSSPDRSKLLRLEGHLWGSQGRHRNSAEGKGTFLHNHLRARIGYPPTPRKLAHMEALRYQSLRHAVLEMVGLSRKLIVPANHGYRNQSFQNSTRHQSLGMPPSRQPLLATTKQPCSFLPSPP